MVYLQLKPLQNTGFQTLFSSKSWGPDGVMMGAEVWGESIWDMLEVVGQFLSFRTRPMADKNLALCLFSFGYFCDEAHLVG